MKDFGMAATTMMHIRIDEETKALATRTLDELGISLSDAVRIFLKRVVADEGLPFPLKLPSARTRAAIAEADALSDPRFDDAGELLNALRERSERSESETTQKK